LRIDFEVEIGIGRHVDVGFIKIIHINENQYVGYGEHDYD
jgi:hypothetical protein